MFAQSAQREHVCKVHSVVVMRYQVNTCHGRLQVLITFCKGNEDSVLTPDVLKTMLNTSLRELNSRYSATRAQNAETFVGGSQARSFTAPHFMTTLCQSIGYTIKTERHCHFLRWIWKEAIAGRYSHVVWAGRGGGRR